MKRIPPVTCIRQQFRRIALVAGFAGAAFLPLPLAAQEPVATDAAAAAAESVARTASLSYLLDLP